MSDLEIPTKGMIYSNETITNTLLKDALITEEIEDECYNE